MDNSSNLQSLISDVLIFFGEFSKQAKNSCVVSVVVCYVSDLALFFIYFFQVNFIYSVLVTTKVYLLHF